MKTMKIKDGADLVVDTCTCCTCSLLDTAHQGWQKSRHSRSLQQTRMHLSAQKFV